MITVTPTQRRRRLSLCAFSLAAAAFSFSSQAASRLDTSWCAGRCDQVVIDWNLQTHQVIKAADGRPRWTAQPMRRPSRK